MTDSSSGSGLVTIGQVLKPHGIRGELRMSCHADSPFLFDELDQVSLVPAKGKPRRYSIKSWREHKQFVLLKLKGVDDRDQVEAMRGWEIAVDKADLPELDDGQVYLNDLIGLRVVTENGRDLGRFTRFIENPGQDVWVIENPEAEIMLPAVDEFIVEFDLDAGEIVVAPPEGLVELYLPDSDNSHRE